MTEKKTIERMLGGLAAALLAYLVAGTIIYLLEVAFVGGGT